MSHSASRLSILDSKDKLLVKGLHSAYVEPLRCLLFNTLNISVEKNSQWQLQFTAYDDGSLAFHMLSVEASVWWGGQEYIVKQFQEADTNGFTTYQVTAIHVAYDVQRVRQRQVKTGTLTYTVESVLSFYLAGNSLGYTWQVIGNFGKEQITDLGNSSGKDMLDKIVSTWPDAIFYPDNKNIRIYQHDALAKNLGNRIDYLHNTPELKLTYDSSSIVNQVMASGKTKENSDGNSDKTEYYFEPFLVTDQASVNEWGLHPGEDVPDERFIDKDAMKTFALSQLTPQPTLVIDISELGNEEPTLGEIRRLENRKDGFVTEVEVVAFTFYPLDNSQATSVTLNDQAKTILNYKSKRENNLIDALRTQQAKIILLNNAMRDKNTRIKTLETGSDEMQSAIDELKKTVKNLSWQPGNIFVDLSSNNGQQTDSWYKNLKDNNIAGAIIKLTESSSYVNPLFEAQKTAVEKQRMEFIGTYHYLKSESVDEGRKEGEWYLKKLEDNNISKNTIIACDLEDDILPNDIEVLTTILRAFYAPLIEAGYTNTTDYSSNSWFESRFNSQGLYKWVAAWGTTKPDNADAWQYATKFGGIDLDMNRSYSKAFV